MTRFDPDSPGYDEIALKARFWNSETVNARLAATFGPDERGAAALLLSALAPAPDCSEDADEGACRLMLAAIRVSGGNLAKLGMWIEAGRADSRDLMAAAEYPRELGGGGAETRAVDLESYIDWVSGALDN